MKAKKPRRWGKRSACCLVQGMVPETSPPQEDQKRKVNGFPLGTPPQRTKGDSAMWGSQLSGVQSPAGCQYLVCAFVLLEIL